MPLCIFSPGYPKTFLSTKKNADSKTIILTVVPEQSPSAMNLIKRLRRQARQKLPDALIVDGSDDPGESFEDLVLDIHSSGYYPVIIIDRFHSFARMADDAIVALLSQMRTLEHSRALTTVVVSSMSYNTIRQILPPELGFVNSAYGDNHDHIVMSPLSYEEFADSADLDEVTTSNLYQIGGGPDCVYQTLVDEYKNGVDGLEDRCIARVSETVMQFLTELDPQKIGILDALCGLRVSGASLPKLAYLKANPLFSFIVRKTDDFAVSVNGDILSSIVDAVNRSIVITGDPIMNINLLIISANPKFDLDVDKEVQIIHDLVEASAYRASVTVNCTLAVTPDSFLRSLRKYRPNIVHFSGHGSNLGILMRGDGDETHMVQGSSLATAFRDRHIDLVVFNACFSSSYADALALSVKTVVGTHDEVGDEAALRFSRAFYRTLFDGHAISDSLKDAMDAVELYDLDNVYEYRGDISMRLAG